MLKLQNKHIFYLILLVALATRCYQLFAIPFSVDELSALSRLDYSSFSELIEKGVKVDGHPAGVQVFLYYWVKLFGSVEWVVKLPFIFMGIASIGLLYAIGKRWFNESVGLFSSAFLATMQYAIIYSQTARPYSSGLFFILLMVWAWTKLIQGNKPWFSWNTVVYVLAASLATYNHHFSLLAAFIIGITGVFFVSRDNLMKYVGVNTIIILLYVPHLTIFLHQLNTGGIGGWLMKPSADFLIQYIFYLFHFSWWVMGLVSVLFILSFIFRSKKNKNQWLTVSVIWFLIPYVTGLIYSISVDAVLQFSVLIFTFPFLFFILFGRFKRLTPKWNLLLVISILFINTFTLIYVRKHYQVFYNPIDKQSFVDYKKVTEEYQPVLAVINSHKNIANYYQKKYNTDSNYYFYEDVPNSLKELKKHIELNHKEYDYLYLARLSAASPLLVPIIQEYYPRIEIENHYFLGSTYIFSKDSNEQHLISKLSFENELPKGWQVKDINNKILKDTIANTHVYSYSEEFEVSYETPMEALNVCPKDYIDVSVEVTHETPLEEIILCLSLTSGDETTYWGGTNLKDLALEDSTIRKTTMHHSFQLTKQIMKNDSLIVKAFLWNKSKSQFMIDDFTISKRKGNPVVYGLIEKIE